MPIVWSRFSRSLGQISSILGKWPALLRWMEWASRSSSPWISSNKASICNLLLWIAMLLLLLLLAGHGGEGEVTNCDAVDGSRGFRSSSAMLVLWRDTRWSSIEGIARLPWWKQGCASPVARLPNKRCCLLCCDGQTCLVLLSAGLGGEGEEADGDAAAAKQRRRSGFREHATSAAVPKRQPASDVATHGQKGGPAALGLLLGLSSFFLLGWRIFLDYGTAGVGATSPSGLVLGRLQVVLSG